MSSPAETVGRAMWEAQKARIKDPEGINARLTWRSNAAPSQFWDSYIRDAEVAITSLKTAE